MSPDIPERPVLVGQVSTPTVFSAPGRGSQRVTLPGGTRQGQRLDARFASAIALFDDQVDVSTSVNAADPELVLVFEAIDEQTDIAGVAKRLGMEVLIESESEDEPDLDFAIKSKKPRDETVTRCLHAVCLNKSAFDELLTLWNSWKRDEKLQRPYGRLADLFAHLKDVRPWGPEDRVRIGGFGDPAGLLDDRRHLIEVELWFRRSTQLREAVERNVADLVVQAGGSVVAAASDEAIGYHALKCIVPVPLIMRLAAGDYAGVQLVRSPDVMYLRVTGQAGVQSQPDNDIADTTAYPVPSGTPSVCLMDGLPVANHTLLTNRLVIHDPDDLENVTGSQAGERHHGTAMASAVIWGDRSVVVDPISRPLLVRPILAPSPGTRTEEVPEMYLIPDVMRRIFRELFDGAAGVAAAGPDVVIVNLSVADPAMPFDTIMSSWARIIDWLCFEYGVLFLISAGNHPNLTVTHMPAVDVPALVGPKRRDAIQRAISDHRLHRRILSPSESINGLAVGALHADDVATAIPGYRFDPSDGEEMVSPISAIGGGYRRAVKPELVASGGRAFFASPMPGTSILETRPSPQYGPGILVAAPTVDKETHVVGTSPAAALTTRRAFDLNEMLLREPRTVRLTKRQRAVGVKALLVHGARHPANIDPSPLPTDAALGFGALSRDIALGCEFNEATVIYFGNLGASEEQDLLLPLPDGLQTKDAKRVTATLAWFSPINWCHRQYRRARLSFSAPTELPRPIPATDLADNVAQRGACTVKHLVWDTQGTVALGQGDDLRLRVRCTEQAGGLLGERVDYAVAMTLWLAPEAGIDVYSQVRDQIRTRVPIKS